MESTLGIHCGLPTDKQASHMTYNTNWEICIDSVCGF